MNYSKLQLFSLKLSLFMLILRNLHHTKRGGNDSCYFGTKVTNMEPVNKTKQLLNYLS